MKQYGNILEALDYKIWDTESLSKNEIDFFQDPIGVRNKTRTDTRMCLAGVLPTPERMLLKWQPRVVIFSDDGLVPLNRAIWMDSHFSFIVNSKYYFQGPLFMFAHPVAILHGADQFYFFTEDERKRLVDSVSGKLEERTQVMINPLDPFIATIRIKIPNDRYKAIVGLSGDYDRAI